MEYVLLLMYIHWPTNRPASISYEYRTELACKTAAANFSNEAAKAKSSVIWTCDPKGSIK